MKKAHSDVEAFHRLVGASIGDVAKPDATKDLVLRVKLIAEEFDELLEALAPGANPSVVVKDAINAWLIARTFSRDNTPNLPEVADALADLEYVTIGSAVTWGIPGAAVWDEVQAANMRKAGGPKDPVTGKAGKPPGWKGPDVEGVLKREADEASRRRPHRRGDQIAIPYPPQPFMRWLLAAKFEGSLWFAYDMTSDGKLGRHATLIDVSVCPEILEPIQRERMPCEPR
jgi:predicted HAD superfamily Cof-like phosphohydrolase